MAIHFATPPSFVSYSQGRAAPKPAGKIVGYILPVNTVGLVAGKRSLFFKTKQLAVKFIGERLSFNDLTYDKSDLRPLYSSQKVKWIK